MPLSENERQMWKQQLQYADRVWYQSGILDDGTGTYRNENTVPVYRYIQDYRGDQQLPFFNAQMSDSDRYIYNLSFSITNAVLSLISGRDPEPIVKAKGGSLAEKDAQRKARLNKIALQMVMREGKFKREVDRAIQCGLTTPFGLVRHGFTPNVEEYMDENTGQVFARFRNEKPDYPWIRYYAPWDVRIDPLALQFDPDQSPRWVAFRDVYTETEIRLNPRLIRRRDWKPTFTPAPYTNDKDRNVRRKDSPDVPMLYEAWTVYDAIERKVFSISSGAEREVREADDWEIEWGQLPYSILTLNEQLDSPIGIPFPRMYAHEQAMMNRVWTIINTIISRTRRVIFTNGEAFQGKDDQKENLFEMESLVEFIECSGNPNEVAREIALGTIDPQLVGLIYQLRESVREIIGISQFDRGQRANVETAAEANQIGAGAATQKSRVQTKVEGMYQNILEVTHTALHQLKDDRKIVIPLLGEQSTSIFNEQERTEGFARVTLADLRGNFDIAVRVNSTLPLDTSSQLAKGAGIFQQLGGVNSKMLNQINVHRDLVDYAEQDPDRWVLDEATLMEQAKQAQEGAGPEAGDAAGPENQGTDAATQSLLASIPGGRG